MTAAAVATNVRDGTRTSSPAPMQRAFNARNNAAVPLDTATASAVPVIFAKAFSNASVRGPAVIHSESIASRTAASSRSSNASSDSRAFHMRFEERMLHVREIFIGALIVIRAANVEPIGVAFVCEDALSVSEQELYYIGKIEFAVRRNVFANLGRKNI